MLGRSGCLAAGDVRKFELTDLGRRIVDPTQQGEATVEAFLRVPLYQKLYENYEGRLLPGNSGIEEEIVKFGVTRKSAPLARRAFQRSAEYAGFFGQGRNRLVKPQVTASLSLEPGSSELEQQDEEVASVAQRGNAESGVHPLLEGLWASLPPKDQPFSSGQQEDWIKMATLALKMVYGGTGDSESS